MEHDGVVNPIILSGSEAGSTNDGTARTDQPSEAHQGRSSAEEEDDGEENAEEEEAAATKGNGSCGATWLCGCCLDCLLNYVCCFCYCCCCYCCCFYKSARGIIWDNSKILTRNLWVIFCAVVWNKLFLQLFSSNDAASSALSVVLPLLFIVITTVAFPLKLGIHHTRERAFQVGTVIGGHMTGWAFITLFDAAKLSETLPSAGAAFGASLPLCALYYIGMGRFRKLPAFVARVGKDRKVVWEALEDYDHDLIAYVTGYLLYSLGFQIIVHVAASEEGEDDAAPVVALGPLSGTFILIFKVACALLLGIVEETAKVPTRNFALLRFLAALPKFTTGMCAMSIAFLWAKYIFGFLVLSDGVYYRYADDEEELPGPLLMIADLLTNDWGKELLAALFVCFCYCLYCCFMFRLATQKRRESSFCLYHAYLQFWNRYGDLLKKVFKIAWPVIIGFISEVLFDGIVENLLEKLPEDVTAWLVPLIYFFVAVVATAIYVNSDSIPKALMKKEEEGEEEDARSSQESRDVPVQDIELSSEPTRRKGAGYDNTEEGTSRGSVAVKNQTSQRAASKSTTEVDFV